MVLTICISPPYVSGLYAFNPVFDNVTVTLPELQPCLTRPSIQKSDRNSSCGRITEIFKFLPRNLPSILELRFVFEAAPPNAITKPVWIALFPLPLRPEMKLIRGFNWISKCEWHMKLTSFTFFITPATLYNKTVGYELAATGSNVLTRKIFVRRDRIKKKKKKKLKKQSFYLRERRRIISATRYETTVLRFRNFNGRFGKYVVDR